MAIDLRKGNRTTALHNRRQTCNKSSIPKIALFTHLGRGFDSTDTVGNVKAKVGNAIDKAFDRAERQLAPRTYNTIVR